MKVDPVKLKYEYIGDGPFPLFVYGHGVVYAKGDLLETSEEINHTHFVLVPSKRKKEEVVVTEKSETEGE